MIFNCKLQPPAMHFADGRRRPTRKGICALLDRSRDFADISGMEQFTFILEVADRPNDSGAIYHWPIIPQKGEVIRISSQQAYTVTGIQHNFHLNQKGCTITLYVAAVA